MSSVCKLEEPMVDCDGDNGSRDSVDGSRGKDGSKGGGEGGCEGGCKGDDCGAVQFLQHLCWFHSIQILFTTSCKYVLLR